ncbi:MAG TPA: hypothetical protein VM290_04855 [Gaiellaceae bacterium]|nr:hypothetical protein [Gaiellaceae bacterium]
MRTRRLLLWALALLLAVNAALFVAAPGQALPRSLAQYFFGPKMIRAEVLVHDGGIVRDFRLDQGRIRSIARDSITLLERDGTLVVVPLAPNAEVLVNGRKTTARSLRRGQTAITVRESGRPADTVHASG